MSDAFLFFSIKMLQAFWLEKPLVYTGTQLRSGWIQSQTGIAGDVIVAFIGEANVPIEHMVDLEDVAANAPIYSKEMLHFIIEIFDRDLEKMVLRQHLLVAMLLEELKKYSSCQNVERKGNDLYDGIYKLSVSVATSSPLSCLIHTGVNISSESTQIPTKGLKDYDIAPKPFVNQIMQRFVLELRGIKHAQTKVRPVG